MTLEEIKSLEHITVLEGEYNITITPDYDYYCEVEDTPVNEIIYGPFDMMIQPEYNTIWVRKFQPVEADNISVYGEYKQMVEDTSL